MAILRIFCLFTVLLFSLIPSSHASLCAKPEEFQALNMRALQSELMVAALSCSQSRHYNWFAKTYDNQLKNYGTRIMNFFGRHGAKEKSEKMLNDFVTKMANRASRASLGRSQQQYCSEVASLYGALQKGQFQRVEALANRYYASWHRVPMCKVPTS